MIKNMFKTNIKLIGKQQEAFSLMTNGKNIFLTGSAGTGKTSCIKLFIKMYREVKKMGITSTTGISALLFGGTTLHSFLGIGLGNNSGESIVSSLYKKGHIRKRWKELEVLIIDEVSMLSPELFDKLEYVARRIRNNDKPFGGIQLVLSGDFLQLPCVNTTDFCFQAESWGRCINNIVYLTHIIRQKDKDFQECLNDIRIGEISTKSRQMLNSRIGINLSNEYGIKPTKLYSTNNSVDYINNKELDVLANDNIDFYEYTMEILVYAGIKNPKYSIEKYKKNCNACENLQLCIGAQVMLLCNMDSENGLVNGSRGIITKFVEDIPIVKFLNGYETPIDYNVWEYEENDKKMFKMTQIPLKLAYAVTIHKSQGMSLDYAEIDLSNIFTEGQAYVALSRVKNINGLSIIDIDYTQMNANKSAIEFYTQLDNT